MAGSGIPQLDPAAPYAPADDEKSMALLAHVLQLVGWWIAPLIIFLVKRESRFVSFHALQALFLQILVLVVWVAGMVGFFVLMFLTIPANAPKNAPPPPVVFLFPLIWVGAMGVWVVMLVAAIVYGIKAGRGEWAAYPILGALARRIVLQ